MTATLTDLIGGAVLIAPGLGWLAVVVLSRERRTRARLADPRTPAAAGRLGGVPRTRVGPGDHAPAPPAPNGLPGLPGLPVHDRVPDPGRADRTGGAA